LRRSDILSVAENRALNWRGIIGRERLCRLQRNAGPRTLLSPRVLQNVGKRRVFGKLAAGCGLGKAVEFGC